MVYLAVMEGAVLISAAEVVASLVVDQDVVMVLYTVTGLFQINANNLQDSVLLAGAEVDLHYFHLLPAQLDLPLIPELPFLTLCQIATRCRQQQIPQMRLLRRH